MWNRFSSTFYAKLTNKDITLSVISPKKKNHPMEIMLPAFLYYHRTKGKDTANYWLHSAMNYHVVRVSFYYWSQRIIRDYFRVSFRYRWQSGKTIIRLGTFELSQLLGVHIVRINERMSNNHTINKRIKWTQWHNTRGHYLHIAKYENGEILEGSTHHLCYTENS